MDDALRSKETGCRRCRQIVAIVCFAKRICIGCLLTDFAYNRALDQGHCGRAALTGPTRPLQPQRRFHARRADARSVMPDQLCPISYARSVMRTAP